MVNLNVILDGITFEPAEKFDHPVSHSDFTILIYIYIYIYIYTHIYITNSLHIAESIIIKQHCPYICRIVYSSFLICSVFVFGGDGVGRLLVGWCDGGAAVCLVVMRCRQVACRMV